MSTTGMIIATGLSLIIAITVMLFMGANYMDREEEEEREIMRNLEEEIKDERNGNN